MNYLSALRDKARDYSKRATAWTLEKAVGELALPAALLSTTSNGSYLERGLSGFTTAANALYYGASAYIQNTGVRDVLNNGVLEVVKLAGNAAANIQQDPQKTLYAIIGTYVTMKAVPALTGMARKYLRNRKVRAASVPTRTRQSYVSAPKDNPQSRTINQGYPIPEEDLSHDL
ncbi:hypothetical protein HZB02_01835 [Candidatus Woesearchaeota archaeon]|nr:hypothetical protein [Candidatus Woesearchaeota archaeon]